jgi:ABC-type branched-subunit amino acid transport system ATPase component
MVLLQVEGVSKTFGALQALEGVDLSVQAGTFHGLIGPNGSGKSTLLKAIAGAHFPSSGKITFAGLDVTTTLPYERARAGLSLKFQITAVLPELSVYDNVLLALQAGQRLWSLVRSSTRRAVHADVMHSLERFRLGKRADDLAGALSHGEQQWLEIAMALAREPKLLLLDEPTAGMSHQERRATGELLMPIKDTCALLIVEHDLDFIKDICDITTVLDQGRVVASGPTWQVQDNERVREAYLG